MAGVHQASGLLRYTVFPASPADITNVHTFKNSHTVLIMLSENFYNINGLFVPLKIFGDLNISQAVDNS